MPTLNKPKKPDQKNLNINKEERRKVYRSTKWKKLRLAHLQQHPLCEICQSRGITKLAVDVHHIISFMSTTDQLKRLELAYNPDNLQSLCKECHQLIHNENKSR